jgi:prepilin-type N-terminal cleavage/methylation domain-containing protein
MVRARGFTLVEMMVVLAILAIVAAAGLYVAARLRPSRPAAGHALARPGSIVPQPAIPAGPACQEDVRLAAATT